MPLFPPGPLERMLPALRADATLLRIQADIDIR
jgi:hypothetical protein